MTDGAVNSLPGPLLALRILGLSALLAYPLVTSIAIAGVRAPDSPVWRWYWLYGLGAGVAFLGVTGVGASFRPAGSLLRGALTGTALYMLLGAAFAAWHALRFAHPPADLIWIVFLALAWPVEILQLLGWMGLTWG